MVSGDDAGRDSQARLGSDIIVPCYRCLPTAPVFALCGAFNKARRGTLHFISGNERAVAETDGVLHGCMIKSRGPLTAAIRA